MKYMDIAPDEVPGPKTAPATVDAVVTDIDAENGIVTVAFPGVDGGEPSELQAPAQAGTWQVGAHVSVPQTGAGLPYPVPPPLSVSPGEADRPVVIVGPSPDMAGTPLAQRLASGETSTRAAKEAADTAATRAEQAADTANAAFQDAARAQNDATAAQSSARGALRQAQDAASAAAGAAAKAGQAITAANGKNRVTHGPGAPDSTSGRVEGDIHWVLTRDGGIKGQYVLKAGVWSPVQLRNEAIAALDVAKLTAGSTPIPTEIVDVLWAQIIAAKEIVADSVKAKSRIQGPFIDGGFLQGSAVGATKITVENHTAPDVQSYRTRMSGKDIRVESQVRTDINLTLGPNGLQFDSASGQPLVWYSPQGIRVRNDRGDWVLQEAPKAPELPPLPDPVQVVSTGYEARRTVSNTSWQDHTQTGFSLTKQRQIRIDITAIVDVPASRQILIDAYIQPASGPAHGQVARVLVNPAAKYKGSAAGTILTTLPRGEYTLRVRALATGGASTAERVQAIATIY